MRKGYDPIIAYARDGMIAAVALGADACAEHEWGTEQLRKKFCSKYVTLDQQEDFVDQNDSIPAVNCKEASTIDKNLDNICSFVEEGFFTVTTAVSRPWGAPKTEPLKQSQSWREYDRVTRDRALTYVHRSQHEKEEAERAKGQIATMWDRSDFAFCNKLYGDEKLIKKLQRFFEQIRSGHGAFFSVKSGVFDARKGQVGSGLCIVDTTRLTYAQANYWRVMDAERLDTLNKYHKSRLHLILCKMRHGEISKHGNCDVGYFWPEWADKKKRDEIVYGFNPASNVNADYFGPYTEGQLRRWFDHNMGYRLRHDSPAYEYHPGWDKIPENAK